MADLDTLIATFPSQLQNNALRAAQTGVEQQNLVQNALTMRQNQEGQNTLSQIYSNQNNIDPRSGLPNIRALAPLAQVNPDMYTSVLSSLGRIQDSQSRSNLTNFRVNEEYNKVLNDNVAVPTVQYDLSLQSQGIDPQQRKIMVEQHKKELLNKTVAGYGLPDNVKDAFDAIPASDLPARSEIVNQRQQQIQKGWKDKIDYGRDPPIAYKENDFLGITTNADMSAPYNPTGIAKPIGKPEAIQTDTFKNPDTGKSESHPFTRDAFGRPVDPNTNQPYMIRGTVSKEGSASSSGKYLPAPLEADIKKDDGKYEMRSVRQQQNPDGSVTTTYASGAEAGQEVPTDKLGQIRPASAARPRSAATAYIQKYMEDHPDATADDVAQASADFAVKQGGARAFLAGGKQGDSVRFIGNVVGSHLPILDKLTDALSNNDSRILNTIKNTLEDQFGWTGPVNFDAAKTIVGGEIVKAIQGYAGAEGDRERVLKQLSDSRTPEQLHVVLYTMKSLMSGQLAGLYRQAKTAGVADDKFYELLPPGAKTMLQRELGTEAEQGKKEEGTKTESNALPTQKFNTLDDAISGAPTGKVVNWNGTVFYKEPGGKLHRYVNGTWQ